MIMRILKILSLFIFFLIQTSGFCQSSLYSWGVDQNYNIIKTLKLNQVTCNFDTITRYHPAQGCWMEGDYIRGITATCDYFIRGIHCPNDSGILFLGLNMDTVFILNCSCPWYNFIEYEYSPIDNAMYGITLDAEIYKCNLYTGQSALLTTLPYKYGVTADNISEQCTIDVDSNILYCASGKLAKINLNNGQVDSLNMNIPGDTINILAGIFFDQDRRIIIGVAKAGGSRFYLTTYNTVSNGKSILCKLQKPCGDIDGILYAYNDVNDIYSICSQEFDGDKFYFYNSINGAFIDSCITNPETIWAPFYPKCYNSIGISEKPKVSNIIIYPNPFEDELFIEIEGNKEIIELEIYNSLGQTIFKGNVLTKTIVKMKDIKSGIYLVKLRNGNNVSCKKIIKE